MNWETHGQFLLSYAFLHHLIIKCSITCNCLHLSQLLRKIKPPHFVSSKLKSPQPDIWCGFQFCFFPSLMLIILPSWYCLKRQNALSQKCSLQLMGYSLRNCRAVPRLRSGKSSPRTWCQDRLVKAMLAPRETRPAFQVKCWLVDI